MRNVEINREDVIQAAKVYGTPCLLYEQDEIIYWLQQLRHGVSANAEIIFSVKAAPSPCLIEYFNHKGLFFETASDGELSYLLSLGVSPEKIWVSGQAKAKTYIRHAIAVGVRGFNIESFTELDIISDLIDSNNLAMEFNLRINPNNAPADAILQATGQPSAFGIDEQLFEYSLRTYSKIITGLFVYYGSQFFNHEDIIKNVRCIFELAAKFRSITGHCPRSIDFGGGFGVPEREEDTELDMDALSIGLKSVFDDNIARHGLDKVQFFFESGRYLSARTAVLITRICDIKNSHGRNYIITDGGINQLGVKQKEYRLYSPYIIHYALNAVSDSSAKEEYIVVGTTCTPIDLTHPEIMLSNPKIGDLIVVLDCGGYSLSFSPQTFNGFPTVPQILHNNSKLLSMTMRGSVSTTFPSNSTVPIGSGNEVQNLLSILYPGQMNSFSFLPGVISASINGDIESIFVLDYTSNGPLSIFLMNLLVRSFHITSVLISSQNILYQKYGISKNTFDSEVDDILIFNHSACIIVTDNDNSQQLNNSLKIQHCSKYIHQVISSTVFSAQKIELFSFIYQFANDIQDVFENLYDVKSKSVLLELLRFIIEGDSWKLEYDFSENYYLKYWREPFDVIFTNISDEVLLCINLNNDFSSTISCVLNNADNCKKILVLSDGILEEKIKESIVKHDTEICFVDKEMLLDYDVHNNYVSIVSVQNDNIPQYLENICLELMKVSRAILTIQNCSIQKLISLVRKVKKSLPEYCFVLRKSPTSVLTDSNSSGITVYAVPPERLLN